MRSAREAVIGRARPPTRRPVHQHGSPLHTRPPTHHQQAGPAGQAGNREAHVQEDSPPGLDGRTARLLRQGRRDHRHRPRPPPDDPAHDESARPDHRSHQVASPKVPCPRGELRGCPREQHGSCEGLTVPPDIYPTASASAPALAPAATAPAPPSAAGTASTRPLGGPAFYLTRQPCDKHTRPASGSPPAASSRAREDRRW